MRHVQKNPWACHGGGDGVFPGSLRAGGKRLVRAFRILRKRKPGDVALAERDSNERPAIANLPESIDEYDTILIGYPIWWHTAPMIIGTFLESYDLTGMEIYPFTQSASMNTEQFDNSVSFVQENAEGAQVHDGLFARPSDTEAIDAYLSDNGLAREGD